MPDMESYPLYQNAIKHLEESNIPARMMRTEMVNCSSDLEYLAKLHCIRLAFQYLFKVNYITSLHATPTIEFYFNALTFLIELGGVD